MRPSVVLLLTCLLMSCATKRQLSPAMTVMDDEPGIELDLVDLDEDFTESEMEDVLHTLDELARNPINANTAEFDDLMRIPAMRPAYARALIRQRGRVGRYTSRSQLQSVPGIPSAVMARLEPYLTLGTPSELLRTTVLDPSYWTAGTRVESLTRVRATLETMDGYRDDLPNKPRVYEGPPVERYQRISLQTRHVRLGTHFKAAPGAVGFQTGHVMKASFVGFTDMPLFDHIVAGRYNVSYGMGLSMGGGRIPRRGFDATVPRGGQRTISPYAGSSYSQGHRGAAVRFGRVVSTSLWVSSRGYAGSVADSAGMRWSVSEPVFRTSAERARRDNFRLRLAGVRSEMRKPGYHVGVAGWIAESTEAVVSSGALYPEVGVQGTRFGVFSADVRVRGQSGSYGAEVAVDAGGSYGLVFGGELSVGRGVEITLIGRHMDAEFQSPFGASVGAWSGRPSNERGVYVGASFVPSRRVRVVAYSDQYSSLLPRGNRVLPGRGHDMGLRFLGDGGVFELQATLQMRVRDEENDGVDQYGRTYRQQYTSSRSSTRLDLTTSLLPRATWVTRAEWVWAGQDEHAADHGYLIHQDLSWWMSSMLRLQARVTIFHSESHISRLYGWEPDVGLASSMPAYSGQGSRQYVLLTIKPNAKVDARIKLARTQMPHQYTIGSGNDMVRGNQRTQIHTSILIRS